MLYFFGYTKYLYKYKDYLLKILFSIVLLLSIINANQIAKQIKFEGLTQISEKIALEKLNINKNEPYTLEAINNSIKTFYEFNYFTDIQAYDENNTLIIKFTEKPFIVNIEIEGYKTRDDDIKVLLLAINLKKGSMYTKEKLNSAKLALKEELKKEGYVNSVVEIEINQINSQSVAIKLIVNKGEEIIIQKINYIGAKELDAEQFEENTANKEMDIISWWYGNNEGVMEFSQLEYDHHRIKDIYFQNGFLDAKVDSAFSRIDYSTNKSDIDFFIKEGVQYKNNNITIYTDEKIVPVEELLEGMSETKGKVFNITKLRRDVEYLKTKIANKGYAFVEVSYDIRKDKKSKTVDIIFNIIPNELVYINDVIISGNSRTLDRVVRRNVYLAPKDLFNLTDFKDSQSALKRTGFFSSAKLVKKRVSKTLMNLAVIVEEAPTGNLIFGGGYGSYDGFMINASVNDKNIFGSGLNLGLSLEHSGKNDTATVSLKNPSINDSIYNGSISIYKKQNSIEDSTDTINGDETTGTKGLSIGMGRSLSRHIRIGTTYALEEETIDYDLSDNLDKKYTTSSITPYISFNNTDDYYNARKGMSIGSSLKYAGVGGDAKYLQSSTYLKYFHGFQDKIDYDLIFRFKTSLKVLWDRGEIPNGTTFYLGGVSSVRGYKSYAFQPEDDEEPFKKIFVNTAELSFPLMPKANIRWSLFYDYGMIGEDNFDDLKKSGYGLSIDWYSPVGPLKFIFANAINPDTDDKVSGFEFSLGSTF
ncbi:MAG TPA: outer membrane protein assembly factor BamA [Arcobacter sp.]|nr:outer membrane protein assembly factor BamA [Arcobacter sp.]